MSVETFLQRMLFGLVAANLVVLAWWSFAPASSSLITEALDLDVRSASLHAEVSGTPAVLFNETGPNRELGSQGAERTEAKGLISEYFPSAGGGTIFGSSDSVGEAELLKPGPGNTKDDRRPKISREKCLTFAPFVTYSDAAALAKRIEKQGGRVHIEEQVISRKPDYLVYIEPTASREVARRMLKELKGQSIDCHIIGDGTLMNGLSVGVFSKIAPAEAQKMRVADLGYDVNLMPLEHPSTVYRLLSDEISIEGLGVINSMPCDAVAYVPSIF